MRNKEARSEYSDLDGAPLDASKSNKRGSFSASKPANSQRNLPAGFVPSKWETVDQKTVESQAVTSKWDIFDHEEPAKKDVSEYEESDLHILKARDLLNKSAAPTSQLDEDDDDIDGVPLDNNDGIERSGGLNDSTASNALEVRLSEDRRARLREIELKVMQYQDELESGKQSTKPGWTISEQVEQFRKKIMKSTKDILGDNSERSSHTPRSHVTTPGHVGSLVGDFDSDDGSRRNDPSSRSRRGESPNPFSSGHKSRSNKKRRRGKNSSSSSRSRSRSRSKDRDRSARRKISESSGRRSGGSSRRREKDRNSYSDNSSSEYDERDGSSKRSSKRSKRSRSRSPSAKKHKKKRR